MTRNNVGFEKKYRYLLYRIQQALIEMEVDPKQHRGRRHLENGLYTCEGFTSTEGRLVTHEEMTAIKKEIFADEWRKEQTADEGSTCPHCGGGLKVHMWRVYKCLKCEETLGEYALGLPKGGAKLNEELESLK